jgi:hypothetical protein
VIVWDKIPFFSTLLQSNHCFLFPSRAREALTQTQKDEVSIQMVAPNGDDEGWTTTEK